MLLIAHVTLSILTASIWTVDRFFILLDRLVPEEEELPEFLRDDPRPIQFTGRPRKDGDA